MPTVETYYVNTASTAGGDGTTNNTSGATRAFASLSEAEAALDGNLVSADDQRNILCCGTANDTTAVSFNGSTTDATRYFHIQANPGESDGRNYTGIIDHANYYSLVVNNPGATGGLDISDPYCRITGLQVDITGTTSNIAETISVQDDHTLVDSCFIDFSLTSNGGTGGAIACSGQGDDSEFYNNVMTQTETNAVNTTHGIKANTSVDRLKIYNNTIVGFNQVSGSDGIKGMDLTNEIHNNLVFNNQDDWQNTSGTYSHNASDDNNNGGTNEVDFSPGGTEADDWTAYCGDYVNFDFRPKKGSPCVGAGIGNASDSDVPLLDIMGVTRSTSAPTIGAHETALPFTFIPRMQQF